MDHLEGTLQGNDDPLRQGGIATQPCLTRQAHFDLGVKDAFREGTILLLRAHLKTILQQTQWLAIGRGSLAPGCVRDNCPDGKKKLAWTVEQKRAAIERAEPRLSMRRQCELLGLSRGSWYYQQARESEENLRLMRLLDEQYTQTPFYGVRRMTAWLQRQGEQVNEKRVRRLLRTMGLMALYPGPKTSQPAPGHQIYPYLLREVSITRPDFVWSTDITYA